MLIDIHTHHPTSAVTISAVGLHPWQAEGGTFPSREAVAAADAVGEIGLDKVCGIDFESQCRVFEEQLCMAEEQQKAVVLHCVKAFEEVMTMLDKHTLRAVIFHGFIGSKEQAARAVKKGYYLSFGARTEGSTKTIEALRVTPLNRLFVETDEAEVTIEAMYQTIARLRDIEVEELKRATAANYKRIFSKEDE